MKTVKTLLLVAATLIVANSTFAQTWTQTIFTNTSLLCFASSADGNTLVAEPNLLVLTNNPILISTNGGVTWNTNTLPNTATFGVYFFSVAASADGTKLAGADPSGIICTSTNSGTTWSINTNAPGGAWCSIACSADGCNLAAVAGGAGAGQPGPICVSTNSGATWLLPATAPINHWSSVASSADGTKLVAAVGYPQFGLIYASTNSGATWFPTSAPTNYWSSVASSADGTKLVAAVIWGSVTNGISYPGYIFTSSDSGNTWVSNTLGSEFYFSVALSADGNTIAATCAIEPVVFVSTNFGCSWETNSLTSGGYEFHCVALSADGGKLITGAQFMNSNGSFNSPSPYYLLQRVNAPQLNISPASTNLALSWIIPSTNFVLQQSADLISWADVTNAPALNLTNLQNQVTLSPSNSSGFFRLKTP